MKTEITEVNGIEKLTGVPRGHHWLALVVLLLLGVVAAGCETGWAKMWLLAGLLWMALKITLLPVNGGLRRVWWFAWPGTDAREFFGAPGRSTLDDWIAGAANLLLGAGLLMFALGDEDLPPTLVAWLGMVGLVFVLHFGLFRVLAGAFRQAGMEARPIMDFPLLADSLSDFWGNRWNRGFSVPARKYLFRPLARKHGIRWASMGVFGVSGLLHEIVISVPAGGGYGWPTVYFLIQGAGVLAERRIPSGLGRRLFALTLVLLPVGLLFHSPFINNVMLPFLATAGGKEIPWT